MLGVCGIPSSVQSALHRFTKLHLDLLESIIRGSPERGNQRPRRHVAMQIFAGALSADHRERLTGDTHAIDAVASEFRSYLDYIPAK